MTTDRRVHYCLYVYSLWLVLYTRSMYYREVNRFIIIIILLFVCWRFTTDPQPTYVRRTGSAINNDLVHSTYLTKCILCVSMKICIFIQPELPAVDIHNYVVSLGTNADIMHARIYCTNYAISLLSLLFYYSMKFWETHLMTVIHVYNTKNVHIENIIVHKYRARDDFNFVHVFPSCNVSI